MKHVLAFLILVACAAHGEDYGFVWWADGLRGASRAVYVQTNRYGMAIDTTRANITRLGRIADPLPYAEAASQPNSVVETLPEARLTLRAEVNGREYTCTRAAAKLDDPANYPVRLIDSGRYLNRLDIQQLEFKDAAGNALDAVSRLEIAAWPDSLHLTLTVEPAEADKSVSVQIELEANEKTSIAVSHGNTPAYLRWEANPVAQSSFSVSMDGLQGVLGNIGKPLEPGSSTLDHATMLRLPGISWDIAQDLDRLDRYSFSARNNGESAVQIPMVFAFEGPFQGITGLCPILRDSNGVPTGTPMQISKNWHRLQDQRLLYEGPWFHAVTQLNLPPHGEWRGELAITYARWGGVPSVSHAQLSLIGWGGNQRWDQCAIGSFGESICYDPDVGLNRSMIDDVRPLMVRSMNDGQWEWTHNVGGGDFLVYFDPTGAKQYLTRVKTAYVSPGPCLSKVIYAGTSADGKIDARIEVQSPRSDDINRAFHRIRYEVREKTPFSRLAFYQLGADNYNDHQFTTIARGNADDLTEEWQTKRGGKRHLREAMPCEGAAPWLALLGGIRPEKIEKGAWADRAIVVRAWRARIGGQDVPTPFAAVYGTENGPHSANIELVPPPGVTELLPGDFVEADIELLILPQRAEDYYGPNAALKEALAADGGTWKLAQRFAKGNDLKIEATRGTIHRKYPVEISVDGDQTAEMTIEGGVGYVPITFSGLLNASPCSLTLNGAPVDQSVHGNDFWQTDFDDASMRYRMTYNIPLDGAASHRISLLPAQH